MFYIRLLATALYFWHSSVLTFGRQGTIAHYQLPIYEPPKETCIGDDPNKSLSEVSQGEYSQHKAAVALLDCDERAVRVFTDANFKRVPDVDYFPNSIAQKPRQVIDKQKSRPRPVGALYVEAETIKKLKYWINTHPNRAGEILRYINVCVHHLRCSIN